MEEDLDVGHLRVQRSPICASLACVKVKATVFTWCLGLRPPAIHWDYVMTALLLDSQLFSNFST